MNWFKTLALFFASVLLSLHAEAKNENYSFLGPLSKDSIKVEQKMNFNPLMLFSLPKAKDPLEQKESMKNEEEELGAI